MNRVVVDDSIGQVFESAEDRLELCNRNGKVLGYFTPAVDPSFYAQLKSPNSEEEIQRRLREGGGRPLEDILRDLEARQ